nr:NADPH:adrenodoxin oxidoreductase, mitochondrial isoform X2 [Tanacetum cinerariifolium]
MTRDRSQLINFVQKFLGTVKFGNDHVAKIMGYGDYQIGNVTISRVYYVEGLRHNLFSVGQFCDSNLEVAFCQHTCFIYNLEGVDLLTGRTFKLVGNVCPLTRIATPTIVPPREPIPIVNSIDKPVATLPHAHDILNSNFGAHYFIMLLIDRFCCAKKVYLVGRSGPVQTACTTKELREILAIKDLHINIKEADLLKTSADEEDMKNNHIRRRVFELLSKASSSASPHPNLGQRELYFTFFRKPKKFLEPSDRSGYDDGVNFKTTTLKGFRVTNTGFDALLESLLSNAKPIPQSARYRILAS